MRKTDMPTKLTPRIITAAIDGFESQKRRIDEQITELRAMLPGGHAETATPAEITRPWRQKRSLAVRRRMALAQKERWAKIKGDSEPSVPAPAKPPKAKRKLSAAGRAAIIAASKKMWARKRAAAKAKSPASKKTAPAKKKGAVKKAVVKASPNAAKKSPPVKKAEVKKATAKVTAPEQASTEAVAD